jgi:hypothetical protein
MRAPPLPVGWIAQRWLELAMTVPSTDRGFIDAAPMFICTRRFERLDVSSRGTAMYCRLKELGRNPTPELAEDIIVIVPPFE